MTAVAVDYGHYIHIPHNWKNQQS